MAAPLNALELLKSYQAADQAMALRGQQMAQNSAMFPLQLQQMSENMLLKRQALTEDRERRNALMAQNERHFNVNNQLARDKMSFMERNALAKSNAPQKPIWDQTRGVFVTPPDGRSAGGVVRPEGLPKTAAERKAEGELDKETKRLSGAVNKADIVIGKVDEALAQTGFFSTGLTGETIGKIPGTGAYDLGKTLETIKANLGFRELQEMRENSPTGGALGQVAVQELNFLQAALASLDRGQSEPQLRKNLEQVKKHYQNWKNVVEKARGGQGAQGGVQGGSGGWQIQEVK